MTIKRLCLFSALLISCPLSATAKDTDSSLFALCPVDTSSGISFQPPPVFSEADREKVDISAEKVGNTSTNLSTFSGNVLIERHLLRLRADEVIHDRDQQRLDLKGNIQADTDGMTLSADSGWLKLDSNLGELHNTHYSIQESHLSGKTPLFSISPDKKTSLIDTQFSTCPESQLDWHLDTAYLELDQESATGTAKHTILWVKDVPVLYLPWIQFPLGDERRSGLLMPNMGSSSSNGFDMSLPWYWNIASNQDATITPRYLRKRGDMLQTSYRYLGQNSRSNLDIEYLENDKLLDDKRYLLHLDNQTQLNEHLRLRLLANDASDNEYLKDLGSNIDLANITHLERNAQLHYRQGNWQAGLLAQAYETIDTTIAIDNRPYRRLPQLNLKGSETLISLGEATINASLSSEWVEFKHESDNKIQGSRLHMFPQLSLPLEGNAWFVTPALGYMHTQYDIKDTNGDSIETSNRSISVSSLDTGLFFERELNGGNWLQTLEPRLYYLHIPYSDQSNLPLFDTAEQSFSFASLFRENRFNGIDRIGDANQATLSLSSRLLDKTDGTEFMSFSLGRIFYFEDQQVTLDNTINTANSSDIISEISGQVNRWNARASVQWDTETKQSDKRTIQLNYKASDKAIFNLGYRFHRDPLDELSNIEQGHMAFAWPISSRYSLLGRWNYSLTEERDIDSLLGLEYESCCWALRIISQRYLTDDNTQPYDTSLMFQFVLKGFGSISDKAATDTLKRAILGYQPDY